MLRKFLFSILAAGLVCPCLVAAPAAGRDIAAKGPQRDASVRAVTPIFSQLLAMSLPAGFVPSDEHINGPSYRQEAVPKGETVDDWSQMITVTGAQGMTQHPGVTPSGIAADLGVGYQRVCPESFTGVGVEAVQVDGNDAFVAFLGCGVAGERKGAPYSESAIILVVKGLQDYYTVQWAVRGEASTTPLAFDRAAWLQRLNQLAPIVLCRKVAGEKEPYPSCVERKVVQRF